MTALPLNEAALQDISRTLHFFHGDGGVFEFCIIAPRVRKHSLWGGKFLKGKMVTGWSDAPEKVAGYIAQLDEQTTPVACYVSLNPCRKALLARANNRALPNLSRTKDSEIVRLKHILIDFDPERPAGVSAREAEKEQARVLCDKVHAYLSSQGWPEPLVADSGNGFHLIYKADLENTPENVGIIKNVLEAVGQQFDTVAVKIDRKVFNPSRICKIYGTWARKGEDLPERPYRRACILSMPDHPQIVSFDQLKAVADSYNPPIPAPSKTPLAYQRQRQPPPYGIDPGQMDVQAYLDTYGVSVKKTKPWKGGTLFILQQCLFDESHSGGEASIGQQADGKLYYQCYHNSCQGRTWKEARQTISGSDKLTQFFSPGAFQPQESKTRYAEFDKKIAEIIGDLKPEAIQADIDKITELVNVAGQVQGAGIGKALASILLKKIKAATNITLQDLKSKGSPGASGEPVINSELPGIQTNRSLLSTMSTAAWAAITAKNDPPTVFSSALGIAVLETDRNTNDCFLKHATPNKMRNILKDMAYFFRVTDDQSAPDIPPKSLCEDLLEDDKPPVPHIQKIMPAPFISGNKIIHLSSGYSKKSKCYLHYKGAADFPEIATAPTAADVETAKKLVDELLFDFPFVSRADRANAVALFLLPYVISLIDGPTPLHLFTASTPGTGKSLLVVVLTWAFLGREIPPMPESRDDEETRKKITAALSSNPAFIFFDNIKRRLDSGSLAAVLTARTWEDRLLGKSEILRLPITCGWIATANNPTASTEIARRTIRIRLDAKMAEPFNRNPESFRHPDIIGWINKNRSRLIWAALTICQNWISKGCPEPQTAPFLGSYESWRFVIGGILEAAEIPGFLENKNEFYQEADSEGQSLRQFISEWWTAYAFGDVAAKDLFKLAEGKDIPLEIRGKTERGRKTSFGRLVKSLKDRRFTISIGGEDEIEIAVRSSGTLHRAQLWKLEAAQTIETVGICEPCEPQTKGSHIGSHSGILEAVGVCEPCELCEPFFSPRVCAEKNVCAENKNTRVYVKGAEKVHKVHKVHSPPDNKGAEACELMCEPRNKGSQGSQTCQTCRYQDTETQRCMIGTTYPAAHYKKHPVDERLMKPLPVATAWGACDGQYWSQRPN